MQPRAQSPCSPQKPEEAGRTLARSLRREPALPTAQVRPCEPDFGLWLPERGEALLLRACGVWSSTPAAVGGCHESPEVASQRPAHWFPLPMP